MQDAPGNIRVGASAVIAPAAIGGAIGGATRGQAARAVGAAAAAQQVAPATANAVGDGQSPATPRDAALGFGGPATAQLECIMPRGNGVAAVPPGAAQLAAEVTCAGFAHGCTTWMHAGRP